VPLNRIHSVVDHTLLTLRALSDEALLSRLGELVRQERECVADVIEHLMEVGRRELALDAGFSSPFEYCVKVLGYSQQAAYFRLRAAEAARRFPDVLTGLRSGRLHLDAVVRIYPHLTHENERQLLARVEGSTEREVKALVAAMSPEPPPERDLIVTLAPKPSNDEPLRADDDPVRGDAAPAERGELGWPQVVAPPQHRFHFTGDDELLTMITRLRGLLRHKVPDGRLEAILKEAVAALLAKLENERRPRRRGLKPRQAGSVAKAGRKGSRCVPRTVKRFVWERDQGRCAYVSAEGRRCESRDALEFDHIIAWADGGRSDDAGNIRLLCRPHNQRLGRERFGDYRRKP
jgi:hypothetical protein